VHSLNSCRQLQTSEEMKAMKESNIKQQEQEADGQIAAVETQLEQLS
jgi:hypothetical protein